MAGIEDFNKYFREYDLWFDRNELIYFSELNALRHLIPENGSGIEIGSGSGKFAIPLGIDLGIEPSEKMLEAAVNSGVKSIMGTAESLPVKNLVFDFALMVTTICFIDDPRKAFNEVFRILKDQGSFIVGFVDKMSRIGQSYLKKKEKSKFYKSAKFYSVPEIYGFITTAGFSIGKTVQTLFKGDNSEVEYFKNGYGEGGFIGIQAIKKKV